MTLDNVLKLTQTVAIVVAGLWALGEYLSFKQTNDSLTIEQQKLSIAAAELTAHTAALLHEADRVRAEKTLKQRFLGDFEVQIVNPTLTPEGSIQADVKVRHSIENLSEKTIEVSYVMVEHFVGSLSGGSSDDSFVFVNPPKIAPTRRFWLHDGDGAITWERVGVENFALGDAYEEMAEYFDDVEFKRGGSLLGTLDSGEKAFATRDYLVNVPQGGFVAIAISTGIDRARPGENLWINWAVRQIAADGPESSAAK